MNGDVLKGLSIFGAVMIALVMLGITKWIVSVVLDVNLAGEVEAFVGFVGMLLGGGAGAAYADRHDVHLKDEQE